MDQVIEFFSGLFETKYWPARWVCGKWTEFHGWLYIVSDLAIWAAYFTIPLIMYYFLRKRDGQVPFARIFWLYMLFILACGLTHLLDAIVFWQPMYRLNALVLFGTAVVSWITVFGLIKSVPEVAKIKMPHELEAIIQQRTLELEETNAQLRKATRELDDYIYATSHDLKAPLSNLEGLLAIVRNDPNGLAGSGSIVFPKMEMSLSRLRETLGSLSAVMKIRSQPFSDVEIIQISDAVAGVVENNSASFQELEKGLKTDLREKYILFSRSGFNQILENLLSNAIKYRSAERPLEVTLSSWREQNTIYLSVADNGTGIDLKRAGNRLFQPYARFHGHVEGTGIGLYTVRRILEENNGEIKCSSAVGQGTTFEIKLNKARVL